MAGNLSPDTNYGKLYGFINAELKAVNTSFSKIQEDIASVNTRLAVLESKFERNNIDTQSIDKLNVKLDVLNSKITGDIVLPPTKGINISWIQLGKIIGLVLAGVATAIGGFMAAQ